MLNRNQSLGIIVAAIIGGLLVLGAFYYNHTVIAKSATEKSLTLQRDYDAHIYGNPKADTTIVEFSDVECPFCARLHTTLETLVDQSNGTINWEYRHLPLPNHRNAELGAVAVECVAELADPAATWSFLDTLFKTQGRHSKAHYIKTAEALGINVNGFEVCLADNKKLSQVRHDAKVARSFGGSGTPFSVIIFPDGSIKPISGALPIEAWQAALAITN